MITCLRAGVILLVFILGGCGKPLRVLSETRLRIDTPFETKGRVATDISPVQDTGPARPVSVGSAEPATAGPKIAVVDVDGLLVNQDFTGPYSMGDNPVASFREKLDAIEADPQVKGVIVRINTPGGSVTASDIMWRDLSAFRERTGRPVIACLLDVGAGGGYYLATAADRIVAAPTSITGGIGVILNLYNLRDAMAYFNVVGQAIKAGPLIDAGSPVTSLNPEARKILQSMADEFHGRFRQLVQSRRPKLDAADLTNFDGRVFTSSQAIERGLIDSIGYLDDAVLEARRQAKEPAACVVMIRRPNDPPRSIYSVTPNTPLQASALPLSVPGLDRSRLPAFLYLWQPEATIEKLSGK